MNAALAGDDGLLPSTYLSVKADWSFGLAYVNGFNLVRPGPCLAGPLSCCLPTAASRGGPQQSQLIAKRTHTNGGSWSPETVREERILL